MIRKILFYLMLAISAASLRAADGDWRLHLSFDNSVKQLFDAGDRLYILAYGQPYIVGDGIYKQEKVQLFVHDKSSGETLGYSMRNYLSSPMIADAQYNPRGGYLCIIYTDGNMDLVYDNDRVVNIPALKNSTLTESKNVNSITFGLDDGNIYLATDFGFAVIDPQTKRIAKARNYHHAIRSIARVGKKLVLSDTEHIYIQDYDAPLQSLSEFNTPAASQTIQIGLPLENNQLLACLGWETSIFTINDDNTFSGRVVNRDVVPTLYSANKQGYMLYGVWALMSVKYDGTDFRAGGYAEGYSSKPLATADYRTFYALDGRNGIRKLYANKDIGWDVEWTLGEHLSRPNAPACFWAAFMNYSDKYGLLAINQSHNRLFDTQRGIGALLSGLKNGEWTPLGYPYTNPTYADVHHLPKGIAIDPTHPDIIYIGSRNEGMQIMNLADPNDVVTLAGAGCASSELPGFIALRDYKVSNGSSSYFNLDEPQFDGQGNLWAYHDNSFDKQGEGDLYVWPASALKNKDYRTYYNINTGISGRTYGQCLPLKAYVNRNLVLLNGNLYNGNLVLLDHKGTLDNPDDDRVMMTGALMNQDGGSVTFGYIYCMYEDEETGTVWIGCDNGVFTIQPSKMFDNPNAVRRIKVARNDGTNLADYLLDGADVRHITSDGAGNKWFATFGAGVVQTSSDGTHVMRQLTMDNSYLPSDNTFRLCYNPANNSMMIGTWDGIAEYFVPGASTGTGFDQVKIYPNPVRPDFVGYVTIEGLLDNSLVKIVDSEGNLVKELGAPRDGLVRWDGTNVTGARVNSGVYFVFMSRSGENASEANVGKVLVVK